MTSSNNRLYFIDWLRVLAFGLLIVFHCAMPFVEFGWEIKNKEHSIGLSRLIWWLHQWRLPLLFFIAGVGSYFSLSKRSAFSFLGERFVRLFIPLWFAILFTTPLQVYFEKTQRGLINMSYWQFYPSVWSFVPYPQGTLTWSHLWFVAYLFVFTVLLWPLFLFLKWKVIHQAKQKLDRFFKSPILVFSLAAILVYYYFALYIRWPEQGSLVDDWFLFLFSMTLFLFGYLLASFPSFWHTCENYRWYFLAMAALCIGWLYKDYWWGLKFPKAQEEVYEYGILNAIHIWTLILAILGFARKHLNYSNAFLTYASPAVYPFYILHQTLIVGFGFYVVQWPIPIWLKLLILIVTCVGGVIALYHFIIKNFLLTRILFGLKAHRSL
jgi:glucan biosynthesis protein C